MNQSLIAENSPHGHAVATTGRLALIFGTMVLGLS